MVDRKPDRDLWTYRSVRYAQRNLTGMAVEALDGLVGVVYKATTDDEASYIVVDTGPWIFDKKVLLPAGVICNVDFDAETLLVDRTKEQIRNAPRYDEREMSDPDWRRLYQPQIASYYGLGRPR